ncbi:hypothetical protein WAI453_002126 [Rhynchosporium graminicola]
MTSPGMRHSEASVSLGRKYKSRKERPCDACHFDKQSKFTGIGAISSRRIETSSAKPGLDLPQSCYRGNEWAVLRAKGGSNGDVPMHFTVVPDTRSDARLDYHRTIDTESVVTPYANELLHTYFEVVHKSYPLLDPARFNSSPKTGDPLLAVIYNIAAPFCQSTASDFPALSSFIQQTLSIEHQHPQLETLEASLLNLQRNISASSLPTISGLSSFIGSLVGVAHDLGLNNDPSSWSLSVTDTNRRIRIWWALYIQDKWSALGLGRPSYLNDEHSNVPLPTLSNFSHVGLANTPSSLTPALQFVAMAHLSTILSDILNTFYTHKALERIRLIPIETLLSIFDGFQTRLRTFRDEHLCSLCSGNISDKFDSTGSVVLAFYTMEIVLLRAVLRCLPMSHPEYSGLRGQAKTTLLNVVEFLEKMSISRLNAFWWSPMSRLNFSLAGSFMFFQLLTSHTSPDIELWSATIAHYRSLLRLHSTSFEMTSLASMRMDQLAQGMGVDSPIPLHLEREDSMQANGGILGSEFSDVSIGGAGLGMGDCVGFGTLTGSDSLKREVLDPVSADNWILRQGDGGFLLC